MSIIVRVGNRRVHDYLAAQCVERHLSDYRILPEVKLASLDLPYDGSLVGLPKSQYHTFVNVTVALVPE